MSDYKTVTRGCKLWPLKQGIDERFESTFFPFKLYITVFRDVLTIKYYF